MQGKEWKEWVWILGILLFVVMLDFVLPLIDQRGKGSYREKLIAQQDARESAKSLSLFIHTRFGNLGITTFFIITLGLQIAYTAGKAHAQQQEEFLVIDQSPEVVVLRVYGDTFITAHFNRSTKEIEKKFVLFKLSDESPPITATLEELGRLRPKP